MEWWSDGKNEQDKLLQVNNPTHTPVLQHSTYSFLDHGHSHYLLTLNKRLSVLNEKGRFPKLHFRSAPCNSLHHRLLGMRSDRNMLDRL
jgi:hypothetical protein